MKTAIVILNWNGRKMLEEYLPTVLEYSLDNAEVIIADNASTDDSLQWLGDNYPKVRTIVLNQNFGFAEGYNKALAQIDSEYYILLNSDVKVTPHWLVPLTEYMDSPQVDHVAVSLINMDILSAEEEYSNPSNKTRDSTIHQKKCCGQQELVL